MHKLLSEINNAKIPVRPILLLIVAIPLSIVVSWFLWFIMQPTILIMYIIIGILVVCVGRYFRRCKR
jgi:hypothetical protein